MLRIHFTVEDLSRLRMVSSLGPMSESAFALNLLGRNNSMALRPWWRRLRSDLGGGAGEFEWLMRERGSLPELMDLLRQVEDGDAAGSTGQQRGAATLVEFCRSVVLPNWGRIRGHLEQVRDARGRIVIANGIERLLSSLHPKLHWNAPALEIHHGPDEDVYLNGSGLLLSPSFFLHDKSCLFVKASQPGGMPALAFPINATMKSELGETWEPDEQALGDLVGHTRAAALHALTSSCTTGMLGKRLGISLAGASKHAAVLRRSGLITTTRDRNTALHSLTPLGQALLHHRGLATYLVGRPDGGGQSDCRELTGAMRSA